MIVAIYLKENNGTLPVNAAIRVYNVNSVSRERRGRERRHPAFSEILTRTIAADKEAKRSDNYNMCGQFVEEQEQLFNKLA